MTIYHNPECATSRNTLAMIGDERLSDETLIDAMMKYPIFINRPLVVTPLGVRLCWPSEVVLEILPAAQRGAFAKEDGERVIDASAGR